MTLYKQDNDDSGALPKHKLHRHLHTVVITDTYIISWGPDRVGGHRRIVHDTDCCVATDQPQKPQGTSRLSQIIKNVCSREDWVTLKQANRNATASIMEWLRYMYVIIHTRTQHLSPELEINGAGKIFGFIMSFLSTVSMTSTKEKEKTFHWSALAE